LYFNNIQNKEFADEDIVPVIQKSDLLSITVSSLNPEATIIFNTPNQPIISTSTGTGSSSQSTGYLVNGKFLINYFPGIIKSGVFYRGSWI